MIKYIASIMMVVSFGSSASFYIDYQGLKRPATQIEKNEQLSMNGYRLLTDELNGLIFEVGTRTKEIETHSNFADDTELKYAISGLIPDGWKAFIDEKFTAFKPITYNSEGEPWLNVLARVGAKYGYKFVVDWENKQIQLSEDEYFVEPDLNKPVVVENEKGESYFIYKTQKSNSKGYLIINGELVEIKVK